MPITSRTILDNELKKLTDDIMRLSSMVETNLTDGMDALIQRNTQLAHQVVVYDEQINRLRYDIETDSLLILATQAPTASDLRTVIAGIHLAVELERIGDHAAGIARLVERMESEEAIENLHKLPKMYKRARKMIRDATTAFVQRDLETARRMLTRDDKLDRQYRQLFQETMEEMHDDAYIKRATYLLWVGHNLERIGDRATNIAERVIFMITGEFVEIVEPMDAADMDNDPTLFDDEE
jgi:phosphate transport system protein